MAPLTGLQRVRACGCAWRTPHTHAKRVHAIYTRLLVLLLVVEGLQQLVLLARAHRLRGHKLSRPAHTSVDISAGCLYKAKWQHFQQRTTTTHPRQHHWACPPCPGTCLVTKGARPAAGAGAAAAGCCASVVCVPTARCLVVCGARGGGQGGKRCLVVGAACGKGGACVCACAVRGARHSACRRCAPPARRCRTWPTGRCPWTAPPAAAARRATWTARPPACVFVRTRVHVRVHARACAGAGACRSSHSGKLPASQAPHLANAGIGSRVLEFRNGCMLWTHVSTQLPADADVLLLLLLPTNRAAHVLLHGVQAFMGHGCNNSPWGCARLRAAHACSRS